MGTGRRVLLTGMMVSCLVLSAVAPVGAGEINQPLFDKFSFSLGGSWVGLTTEIRLDSEVLGKGTTLSFEDDLNLASNETIPTVSFAWQIARKHKLDVRWQDINRDSSAQALTEIQWGDEIIPIDSDIALGFDITQYFIDYTYYPWVNDRWAAGFGLGLRVMEMSATLAWRVEGINEGEGSTDAKGTGPLPYFYFEYRRLFSDNWRFTTGLGWLYVKIDDIEGGQWVARAGIEYLLGDRWSLGGSVNLAHIDVDWAGVETRTEQSLLTAALEMDINDVTLFARVRF